MSQSAASSNLEEVKSGDLEIVETALIRDAAHLHTAATMIGVNYESETALCASKRLKAEAKKLRAVVDLTDRRVDDALVALNGIDYEEGSRVDRAVSALDDIRNVLAEL